MLNGIGKLSSVSTNKCVQERQRCSVKYICLEDELHTRVPLPFKTKLTSIGVTNGTSKNVGLGKFWQDLEISEAFLISLEVSFLHGLYLLFLSLETFYQRVSGSDF